MTSHIKTTETIVVDGISYDKEIYHFESEEDITWYDVKTNEVITDQGKIDLLELELSKFFQ